LNIYAVKDRLIDYFLQPFAGPDDKAVLAAMARQVNTENSTSDIAQAPHHFEVWRLGRVNDEGHIDAKKEFLADCSSLIRPGIRTNAAGERGDGAPAPTLAEIERATRAIAQHTNAQTGTPTHTTRPTSIPGEQAQPGHQGRDKSP